MDKVKKTKTNTESVIYPYHLDIIGKTHIPIPIIDSNYMEYRKQWEINPRDKIVSDYPLHLDIEVTGRCNLMCQHCFRHSRKTTVGDMDFDLFKKIIDEGAEHCLYAINLCWMGESFMHPRLIDMVAYTKSKGILDVIINTNGILVDKEKTEKILESKSLDVIIFSLDAVTKEKYNRIKYGSDFRLVNNNIRYFIEEKERRGLRKPNVVLQIIDQKQTHEELMAFIQYWRTKADIIRISTYQSPDGRKDDKRRYENPPDVEFPCPELWRRLVVSWDGTVYPCPGDNACRNPLGNIKEKSIHSIWHGDYLNALREKHANFKTEDVEMCLHCDSNKIPEIVNNYDNNIK